MLWGIEIRCVKGDFGQRRFRRKKREQFVIKAKAVLSVASMNDV